MDSPKPFSNFTTSSFREHTEGIGNIAIMWNACHAMLWHYFWALSGLQENVAKSIYFTLKSDTAQRNITHCLAREVLRDDPIFLHPIDNALVTMAKLSSERNAFMHAMWAVDAQSGNLTPNPMVENHKRLNISDITTQMKRLESDLATLLNDLVELAGRMMKHYSSENKLT